MMRIEGLESVVQRIEELNNRFGLNKQAYNKNAVGKANSFADELKAAEGRLNPSTDFSGKTVTPASFAGDTGSIISAAAQKDNVDPKLVAAIAQTESGGNQAAISSAGAVGIMQLMPDTAAALGVDPYNKQQNIDGGTKYIRQMLDTFNGDVKKAVAAYNAGPQAVKDYDGVPPYQETQNYVNKVLDIYR